MAEIRCPGGRYHANNMNVAKHLRDRFPHPYTARPPRRSCHVARKEDPQTNLAIEVDGVAAGGFGYVRGNDVERYSAEVGYWLGESYWGRGICTEALRSSGVTRFGAAAPASLRVAARRQSRLDPGARKGWATVETGLSST